MVTWPLLNFTPWVTSRLRIFWVAQLVCLGWSSVTMTRIFGRVAADAGRTKPGSVDKPVVAAAVATANEPARKPRRLACPCSSPPGVPHSIQCPPLFSEPSTTQMKACSRHLRLPAAPHPCGRGFRHEAGAYKRGRAMTDEPVSLSGRVRAPDRTANIPGRAKGYRAGGIARLRTKKENPETTYPHDGDAENIRRKG